MPCEKTKSSRKKINLNRIGYYLDGWADIVEGKGDLAPEVQENLLLDLKDREMPVNSLEIKNGFLNKFSERREFIVANIYPEINTLITINKQGKDLFVAWRTWLAPRLNIPLLKWMLFISLFIGVFGGWCEKTTRFLNYRLYIHFALPEMIQNALLMLLFEILFIGFGSMITSGGFFDFFILRIYVFNYDDISAMSLSIHTCLLRSLDNAGIDVSKLRIKQRFTTGRRGEEL